MSKIAGIVILLFITGSFASCSYRRLATGNKNKTFDWNKYDTGRTAGHAPRFIYPQPDTAGSAASDSIKAMEELVKQVAPLWQKRFDYKTFSGKAKVHYESPDDKEEFTAHFRIRKDSIIWIAITGLGGMVPVARVYITPDSFILVNQLKKEVTRIPLSRASKVLPAPVDFNAMQNLVVGEPLRNGVITDAKNFRDSWLIQVEDTGYIQRITYNKSDSTMRSGRVSTRLPNGPQAAIDYNGYERMNNQKVSTDRVINIRNGEEDYLIDMNFQRTDFDQPVDFPVSVPSSYTLKEIRN